MRTGIASLSLLCLMVSMLPASAQVLYDNGPVNGSTDAAGASGTSL